MKYRLYKAKGNTGKSLPKWKAKFFRDGIYFKAETLYTDKGKSRERAEELCRVWERQEAERLTGIPQISDRPILELMDEYRRLKGDKGKDGRPWTRGHHSLVKSRLQWWVKVLGLKRLVDISLPAAESALAALPYSTASKNGYFHCLDGFVRWCLRSRLMPYNPLTGFQAYQIVPTYKRAAFTLAEVRALLDRTPSPRKEAYQLAIMTGMRHGELRSLQVADLDVDKALLKLPAANAKNRREAWFHIPDAMLQDLLATLQGKGPQDPLLSLNRRGAEELHRDMYRAGLQWQTSRGVLDFHSFRATLATWLNEYGADLKTIQELMRHASPILTLQTYTKANEERRKQTVENLAGILSGDATSTASKRQSAGNAEGTRKGKLPHAG